MLIVGATAPGAEEELAVAAVDMSELVPRPATAPEVRVTTFVAVYVYG